MCVREWKWAAFGLALLACSEETSATTELETPRATGGETGTEAPATSPADPAVVLELAPGVFADEPQPVAARLRVVIDGEAELYPLPSLPAGMLEIDEDAALGRTFFAGAGVELWLEREGARVRVQSRPNGEEGAGATTELLSVEAPADAALGIRRVERELEWGALPMAGPFATRAAACVATSATCPFAAPALTDSPGPARVESLVVSELVGWPTDEGAACALLLEREGAFFVEEDATTLCLEQGTGRGLARILEHHVGESLTTLTVHYREQRLDDPTEELWHYRCDLSGGAARCERATEDLR